MSWIVGGDFNEILHNEEKIGGNPRDLGQMEAFSEAVNYCALYDLQFSGHAFTWSNGRVGENNIQCKLDRFFGNIQSLKTWPDLKVTYLHSSYLDHLPILLELKDLGQQGESNREKPFRFEKMWCSEEGFSNIISCG